MSLRAGRLARIGSVLPTFGTVLPSRKRRFPLADLYTRFESLGDACELGTLQNREGVETPTFFRWIGLGSGWLGDIIADSLPGVSDFNLYSLTLEPRGEGPAEYMVHHERLRITAHTFVVEGMMTADELLQREMRRYRVLRRKFLEDAADARRIYVYRSKRPQDIAAVAHLHRSLCLHGPNRLLFVSEPRDGLAAGEVKLYSPGLAVAAVDELAPNDQGNEPLTRMWPDILRRTCDLFA